MHLQVVVEANKVAAVLPIEGVFELGNLVLHWKRRDFWKHLSQMPFILRQEPSDQRVADLCVVFSLLGAPRRAPRCSSPELACPNLGGPRRRHFGLFRPHNLTTSSHYALSGAGDWKWVL